MLKEVIDRNFGDGSYSYHYENVYFEFNENQCIEYDKNSISEKDGEFIYTNDKNSKDFFTCEICNPWDFVTPVYKDTKNKKYYKIALNNSSFYENVLLRKKDKIALSNVFKEINRQKKQEQQKGLNFIDESTLCIAENLLNLSPENIMLNEIVLKFGNDIYYLNRDCLIKRFFNSADNKNGKTKKEIQRDNAEAAKMIDDFSNLLDNFTDIIVEEKNIKKYIAKRVAWIATQIKAVEFYGDIWNKVYDKMLDIHFDKLSRNIEESEKANLENKYIKSVIDCEKFEFSEVRNIFIYFLISKSDYINTNIYDKFVEYQQVVKKIELETTSNCIKSKLKTKQTRKISNFTINDIDLMNGVEFEKFIAFLFSKMGYKTEITKQTNDQGLDVIAFKNGERIGIQAKCYSNTVGNSSVQEAVAGKNYYNCDKVLVITNNFFTSSAIKLATTNQVILWNRDILKEKLKEFV